MELVVSGIIDLADKNFELDYAGLKAQSAVSE
jgi:hypothetical protein